MEKNYLSILQNIWTDEITFEQNPNINLITQLNNRTVKYVFSYLNNPLIVTIDEIDIPNKSFAFSRLVRLEVESALANVEFDTLKSQLQLCTQLKKYFDSTPIDDLK